MKKVGLIILSWNNAELLPECFESISKQTNKHIRTVLVDNNSSDNSVSLTREHYPWVEVIQSDKNGGFTAGNNLGINMLLEDPEIAYIGLINSDATLDPDWVTHILEFAEKKPRGALFQGTTLDYYDHGVIDSTHIYISHHGQATQGGWRSQLIGENGPQKVFGTNAAACLISRKFIEAQPFTPFFDESFFMYLEDVDISLRATVMGWDNYYVPGATAYHMGSASSGKNPAFPLKMTYRNNLAMLYKNLSTRLIVKLLPGILRSDYATVKKLVREKRYTAAKALVAGRLTGVARVFLYQKEHKQMMAVTKIKEEYLLKLMRSGT